MQKAKSNRLIGLMDCNNFFVSCERTLRPDLQGKPVVVLSNNDGCVVARSNEAKALGIPMGAPLFQYERFFQSHGVTVFSGNMAFYKSMSRRVMELLSSVTDCVEQASIDEAFFNLHIRSIENKETYCRAFRQKILSKLGIPVSIGISTTKTLCKLAAEIAKTRTRKDPQSSGVCLLSVEEAQRFCHRLALREIWGIGRQSAVFLEKHGIRTVGALMRQPEEWIRKNLSLKTLDTVRELQGICCFPLQEEEEKQKSMMVSSSFGQRLSAFEDIKDALVKHCVRGAAGLRRQGLRAGVVGCTLRTSFFIESVYSQAARKELSPPTSQDQEIITAAVECLRQIYRPGMEYAKVGVFFEHLEDLDCGQIHLEDLDPQRKRMDDLFQAIDALNDRFGEKTIVHASLKNSLISDPHKNRLSLWQENDITKPEDRCQNIKNTDRI